ncbi:MAG: hypothetical protein M5U28_45895 [Sandaracinaceae bacterium]|nr:hypothetical protein [Sandaracinaceae bacterium]
MTVERRQPEIEDRDLRPEGRASLQRLLGGVSHRGRDAASIERVRQERRERRVVVDDEDARALSGTGARTFVCTDHLLRG